MITTRGKVHIKRFLAGQEGAIGRSIALGIGSSVESVNDNALHFEVDRTNVENISYDFVNNRLIFKATIPETYSGIITEVGLYNHPDSRILSSRLVIQFSSDVLIEQWLTGGVDATFTSSQARIGTDALHHTPTASGSTTSTLSNVAFSFSNNLSSDFFGFAFYSANTNVANIKFRFLTDATNYYEFTISSISTGYNIVKQTKGSATATGSPDWGTINSVEVITTANSGGAADVRLDAVRVEDATFINQEYILVSREVLSSPFVKELGKTKEVEFNLEVSV